MHDRTPAEQPVVLLDKDRAASALQPLFTMMINRLVEEKGVEWMRSQLPITAHATLVLASGGEALANASAACQITELELGH